ncbi:hypothetical protein TRICI_000551 [Trichomonascus ciferrii]|uniref:TPR domain protein n=1 Tax=Trichomonascus ciferrii TaxID=44093 RepID=A0A642VD43_9ASCO|nr:hypothetical protein TRICI_000551 [Trichomonascus ciferrii]
MIEANRVSAEEEYYDLGSNVHMDIGTSSKDAQVWFDRGLTWAYGFNHDEAARCFEQAILHDASSAMGYWGLAYALGPNYNKSWWAFDPKELKRNVDKGHWAVEQGLKVAKTAFEKDIVEAVGCRLPESDFQAANEAYAAAMRKVYHAHNGEQNIHLLTVAAEALMNTASRALYESGSGKPIPSTPVFEVKDMLEKGLKLPGASKHPGVLHLYIHLMEMSATPEAALLAADNLRTLVPDSGHIHHMPSHIYTLVGEYHRAVDTNMNATIVDDKYFKKMGGSNFYSVYRLHDYQSLIYAAMLAGLQQVALETTDRMEATITEDLLRMESPPMANWMEFFFSVRVHVMIRFGMWEELKKLPVPEDQELYCGTVAITHYGRALAHAATRNIDAAEKERTNFREAAKRIPPSRLMFPNKVIDILQVAHAMLDGELEYRKGNYTEAFEHLRVAIKRDDNLLYTEPWNWMLPTRHPLAALLLEQGHVEEAAALYAEDLGFDETSNCPKHPNNVWALHGYHECLVRLGRDAEASIINRQLTVARAGSDFPIKSSCACRLGTQTCTK